MSGKTWKLTVNEDELRKLIRLHAGKLYHYDSDENNKDLTIETSARLHDLVKRLNRKDDAEVTVETTNETKEGWS